jgi:hypothetical protein
MSDATRGTAKTELTQRAEYQDEDHGKDMGAQIIISHVTFGAAFRALAIFFLPPAQLRMEHLDGDMCP